MYDGNDPVYGVGFRFKFAHFIGIRAEYERVTRVPSSGETARESLRLLVASGAAYEVRTTVHPDLLGEDELLRLADELGELGVTRWTLQPFRSEGARPEAATSLPSPLTPEVLGLLAGRFPGVEVRG
jgi:pyruvate formate lyase activating enzyme